MEVFFGLIWYVTIIYYLAKIYHNIISNNAFQFIDVRNAKKIYNLSEPSLKGKYIKRKSKLPREDGVLERPEEINQKFESIVLFIDVMHVI